MTQTLPLSLTIGAANTGKLIGYSVLNLDRTEYAAFELVVESAVAGTYYAPGGYAVPDVGGYLVVSESDGGDPAVLTALAERGIEPSGLATLGSGAITFTYTLTSAVDAAPIADADVWVTTDSAGTNVIAVGRTNAAGQVVFYLDAGTVYVWRQKTGWTFINPDTEIVS